MKINLYTMLKTLLFTLENGKNLSSGMHLLSTTAKTKQERKIYLKIHNELKDGSSFSKALSKYKIGSQDVINFISMAEKGVNFRDALKKVINYLEVKDEYERASNEKTSIPFMYLFIATLIVVGVKFFAVPYQMEEAQGYSPEIISIISDHLELAQLMTNILFITLIVVGGYFFLLLIALFSQSYIVQAISKQLVMILPFTSSIVVKFEKFMLFSMLGEMLQSGISFKKAMNSAIATTTVRKFRKALLETMHNIRHDGQFVFHPSLYDNIERGLLLGIGSSSQIGAVMIEISNRAKADALLLSTKFFRLITMMSIMMMAFAVFIEFYTVVLTQILIQRGLIDLTKGPGGF